VRDITLVFKLFAISFNAKNMFKKFVFLFVIIMMASTLDAQNEQLYPVKSGMIKYKFEGRANGTETIYFDDFGKLWSSLKVTSMLTDLATKYDSVLVILRNDTVFELNIVEHTVIIKNNLNRNIQNIISNNALTMLGFTKTGIDIISGRNCDKYIGENGSLWVWNNIVLKSEMEILDTNITKEATEIIMGIDIPKSKFEIPKKYKIKNQ